MEYQFLKTDEEKLRSLISDEAKNFNMLAAMSSTIKQMQAKSSFRIALLNQLIDNHYNNE